MIEKNIYEIVDEMKIGWNLENSLEATAPNNKETATLDEFEEYWGNLKTTKEMILKVKEAEFNIVRVPVQTVFKKYQTEYELSKIYYASCRQISDLYTDIEILKKILSIFINGLEHQTFKTIDLLHSAQDMQLSNN